MVDLIELARQQHRAMRSYAKGVPDAEALDFPSLFPAWAEESIAYAVGDRVQHQDRLYKCQAAHTSQAGWTPDATPALWVVIDVDHAGTADDPIPAARGMEYVYGKHYADPEDGKTYLCKRTGEAGGGTVVLQFLPHELVGQYFEGVAA